MYHKPTGFLVIYLNFFPKNAVFHKLLEICSDASIFSAEFPSTV